MRLKVNRSLSIIFVIISALLGCLVCGINASKKDYTGYKVLRVNASTDSDVERLNQLFERYHLDVWKPPSSFAPHFDVMVPGRLQPIVYQCLQNTTTSYSILIDNVQSLIDGENRSRKRQRRHSKVFRFNKYHSYREIERWLRSFTRSNSDIVSLFQVGTTYQHRQIVGIKISVNTGVTKPVVWQDSLIHAREWITGSTLLWVANKLVRGYKERDEDIVHLLNNVDFVILPVWNVDGYIYTWKTNRLWRKSRSRQGSLKCKGVDLNRNFFTPNKKGGAPSDFVCSDVYQGNIAFSEPETATVAAYLRTLPLAGYITLHSFSQLWLYPFGHKNEFSSDHLQLENVSVDVVRAMESVHGKRYRQGTVSEEIYPVSGGSIDWAYIALCVKYSFAVELRDRGYHGFMLPANQIIPTAEEYFAGFKVLVEHIIIANSTRSSECSQSRR